MSPALTGAFLDIVVVEDLDGGDESEIIIGQTTDDIEVERDTEDADWQEHNNPRLQRMELAAAQDLTFSMIVTEDRENLQNADMIDDEGRIRRNVIHEAVRLNVFKDPQDDEPSTVFQMENTQFKMESLELPIDDVGLFEVEGWINGEMYFLDPSEIGGGDGE